MILLILEILRWIGIILLALLVFLLCLLAVFLFSPFHYKIEGKKKERGTEVKITVNWILRMFSFSYIFREGSGQQMLRVFYKPLTFWKGLRKKGKQGRKKKKLEGRQRDKIANDEKLEDTPAAFSHDPDMILADIEGPQADVMEREVLSGKPFFAKGKKKISSILASIKEAKAKIAYLWKRADRLLEEGRRIWEKEETKKAFEFLIYQLIKILQKLKPKKCKGYLHFGLEDPGTTGEVLAIVSMTPGWHLPALYIYPNFEEKVMEGELMVKGRIRLISLGIVAIQIIRNQDVRSSYREIRKREA